ncbi:4Fe-4S dicluster domain-containing protein [Schinkia azotoformans]|uniref:4Fe-4S dicluster domain-containing protein n=1 Tax=Schinkia azotoformans TaxID=1454 RepID=UPI002DBBDA1F|nr:4Fe-4S dicluster domain-containing protein [Schinkia azotoformans]MEC1718931.1 4Fe-4S binding protein [Schinkia azotoformans]MED4412857.1 4Fe-4S binding protein [Schinkia azotoformans]
MVLAERWISRWMDSKQLTVEKNRCTHAKNQKSSCNICVESCPASAIKIDGKLQVDFETCRECMICTAICPSDVFTDKKYKSYLEQMKGRAIVEIACQKQDVNDHFVTVPCLRMLDETILLYGLQENKKIHIRLNESKCETCPFKIANISSFIEELIHRVELIKQEKVEVYINSQEYKVGEQQQFSRRDLFSFLSNRMQSNIVIPLLDEEEVTNKEREKIALSEKQRFFIQLLKKQKQNPVLSSDVVKTAMVMITDHCTGCLKCTYVCPTGSLYSDEDENQIIIKQNLLTCVECKSCQDICPEESLSLESYSSYLRTYLENNEELIYSFDKKRCTTCGEKLDDLHSTICIECQNKLKQSESVLSFW